MNLGTSYIDGGTVPFVLPDGLVIDADSSSLAALTGGTVKTPTSDFSLAYNGQVLTFSAGAPFMADAALLAAIAAAGQTVV